VRLPALVAAVRDVDGKFVGIHRTFLRRDGSAKADIEPAKASLGPVRGGAVRLATIERVLEAGALPRASRPPPAPGWCLSCLRGPQSVPAILHVVSCCRLASAP
jgi:hypothetical protein